MDPFEDRDPTTYGTLAPEDTLSLIGNEVRAGILWALSDARGGVGEPPVLSFSELRSRVDADVDSSQFNYHLQQLVGHFVERREDESGSALQIREFGDEPGGYALRPEGTMLTRTVRAGTTTEEPWIEPFEVGLDCYFCGTPVEAQYGNWLFKIHCPECAYLYDYNLTPPGVIDDDHERMLANVAEFNRTVRLAFARGTCPLCANGLDTRIVDPEDLGYPAGDRREVLINRSCDHCGHMDYLTVGELLLRDAQLIAFFHERGLNVTSTPIWELEFAATDRFVEVRSTDPWELALEVTRDGDTLELVLDGDLDVVERSVA